MTLRLYLKTYGQHDLFDDSSAGEVLWQNSRHDVSVTCWLLLLAGKTKGKPREFVPHSRLCQVQYSRHLALFLFFMFPWKSNALPICELWECLASSASVPGSVHMMARDSRNLLSECESCYDVIVSHASMMHVSRRTGTCLCRYSLRVHDCTCT